VATGRPLTPRTRVRSWPLLLAIVLIGFSTLLPTAGSGGAGSFCLLCGERGVADFLSNVILFAPFGLGIALRGSGPLLGIAAGALLSGAIELLQLDLIAGRDANFGDVVGNATGTAIGWLVGRLYPWRKARALSLLGSGALAAATGGALLVGLGLLSPIVPPPPYYLHWTPEYENHDLYLGRILSTRLGPLEWQQDYVTMEPGTGVGDLLETEPLEVRMVAGPPPTRRAPILAIQTAEVEIDFLAVEGHDLIYHYWSAADAVGFDHPDLRIARLFDGVQAGDTVDLTLSFDKRGFCVRLNERSHCGGGYAVGDAWSVLISPRWSAETYKMAAFVWLWLVFLPSGYAASNRRRLTMIATGASLGLLAAPLALGFTPTPWYQLGGLVFGMITGYLVAGAYRGRQPPDGAAQEKAT
jgi:hypothetical protein